MQFESIYDSIQGQAFGAALKMSFGYLHPLSDQSALVQAMAPFSVLASC